MNIAIIKEEIRLDRSTGPGIHHVKSSVSCPYSYD